MTNTTIRVVLTGGPGGGKSELLRAIAADADLGSSVVAAEEAIHNMRFVRLNPRSAEFQCALMAVQAATEFTMFRMLTSIGGRAIVTHRGTLDPCAFWQSFGNSRESFFEMTGTTLGEHYSRYDLVIHLESAAVRVSEAYVRYPHAHRPEDIQEATRLDRLLRELWSGHPRYVKIDGTVDVKAKLLKAAELIRQQLGKTYL